MRLKLKTIILAIMVSPIAGCQSLSVPTLVSYAIKEAYCQMTLGEGYTSEDVNRIEIEKYYGKYSNAHVVYFKVEGLERYEVRETIVDNVFLYPDRNTLYVYHEEQLMNLKTAFLNLVLDLDEINMIHYRHSHDHRFKKIDGRYAHEIDSNPLYLREKTDFWDGTMKGTSWTNEILFLTDPLFSAFEFEKKHFSSFSDIVSVEKRVFWHPDAQFNMWTIFMSTNDKSIISSAVRQLEKVYFIYAVEPYFPGNDVYFNYRPLI